MLFFCFFFTDTSTPEIYTLSLHDALPISRESKHSLLSPCEKAKHRHHKLAAAVDAPPHPFPRSPNRSPTDTAVRQHATDRKSTRLNSSHANISYAVFCLKKKKNK